MEEVGILAWGCATVSMPLVDTLKGATHPTMTSSSISLDTIFSDGVMVRIAIESNQTIIDWGNIKEQKRRVIVDTLLQDGDQSQIGNWTFFNGKTHYVVRLGENNNFFRDVMLPKSPEGRIRSFRNPICYDGEFAQVVYISESEPNIVLGIENISSQEKVFHQICSREEWTNEL